MATNTGREITVTKNKSKRTYTIRVDGSKYRTTQMSKEEFDDPYFWTANDWNQFLKGSDYYKVN